MQVTETKAEGLKREYKLVVTAEALDAKTTEKLEVLRKDFHMKGFRKGKAPLNLMKQHFGKSVLGEVVQETVENTVADHLKEQGHRPARQPDVKIENDRFEAGDDLKVEIAYECLPEVPEIDFSTIKLERRAVTVDDAALDEALDRLAKGSVNYEPRRRERQGRGRRPGGDRLHRPDRRRGVRRRRGRGLSAGAWLGQLHPGLRGPAGRRRAPATRRRSRSPSRTSTAHRTWPARTPSSR